MLRWLLIVIMCAYQSQCVHIQFDHTVTSAACVHEFMQQSLCFAPHLEEGARETRQQVPFYRTEVLFCTILLAAFLRREKVTWQECNVPGPKEKKRFNVKLTASSGGLEPIGRRKNIHPRGSNIMIICSIV